MTSGILDKGDVVWYPNPNTPGVGKPLKVLDRQVIIRTGGAKSYVRYLYDGLLEAVAGTMRYNIQRDYDNLIVITGKEGSGKSNLAYSLCKAYDPRFSIEDGYVYEYDGFMRRLDEMVEGGQDKGKVFWLDEATNIASNRDWMHSNNKQFIQLLEMMRSRGWTLILCIPSFERLDIYIREQRVRMVLTALQTSWDFDPETKRGYFELKTPITSYDKRYFKTAGYGTFPPMDAEAKAKYEAIKFENQTELLRIATGKQVKVPTKNEYVASRRVEDAVAFMRSKGMSHKEIAETLNMSEQMSRKYNASWNRRHGKSNKDDDSDEGETDA